MTDFDFNDYKEIKDVWITYIIYFLNSSPLIYIIQ